MKIYVGQINPKLGDMKYNLDIMIDVIDNAISENNDIVVFPELSLTGTKLLDIIFEVGRREVPEILLEKSKEIDIIFGMVELDIDDYYYDTAYYLSNGKILGKHQKIYVENTNYKSGKEIDVIETKFGKVGILLGKEMYNQGMNFVLAQKGAKYIFALNNEIAILGEKIEDIGKDYKILAKANSISNNIYTIVINRNGNEDSLTYIGNSYLVSPMGNILYESEYFVSEEMSWEIDEDAIRRAKIQKSFIKDNKIEIVMKELKKLD